MTAPVRTAARRVPDAGLLNAALAYASRGWHVFPIRRGTKRPATPNHPAHRCDGTDPRCRDRHTGWEQRATTEPERIIRAWTRHGYGIGIATGPSGLVVIDLDAAAPGELTGWEALDQLAAAEGQPMPATFTVITPSGGEHRYYRHPNNGPRLGNTASKVAPNIDTRAHGGYVVAPPSPLAGASPYRVHHNQQALPALPAWLAARLTSPPRPAPPSLRRPPPPHRPPSGSRAAIERYVTAAIEAETQRLAAAAPGTRNNTLFTAAVALGQLAAAGVLDIDHANKALLDAAASHITAGAYSTTQAHSTIASGLHRGMTEPRRLPTHLTHDLEPTR